MHLCAVHAEYEPIQRTWKWDSVAIWVVGPIPDPGQCMTIGDHALVALFHPRQVDKTPEAVQKRFVCSSYKYSVLDPDDVVELNMDDEYDIVNANL